MSRPLVPLLAMVAVLAACDAGTQASPEPQAPATSIVTPIASPTSSVSGTTGSVTAPTGIPATHWAALLSDLTSRGVSPEGIEVVTARSVTWPSGALGCPKPGMAYTQMLVPGYQVVVRVSGRTYDYRFGTSETPRLCAL